LEKVILMDRMSRTSTHANRVDKMSGIENKTNFNSNGRKVVKKLSNAKRRRILKIIKNPKI